MSQQTLEILQPDARNYRDVRYHASGSEAEVYTAEYVPTGDRVALKVLIPRAGGPASRERRDKRFLREAGLLRKAGGAHVTRVYEVIEVRLRGQETKAFSMEWLPETLRDLAARHETGLPVADLDRYLRHAVEGLRSLHEHDVAVRDMRPENLLLSERGELKIADLGMARTDDSAGSLVESSRYMAPEVLDGTIRATYGEQDPPPAAYFPVDVYGLGLIFYEAAVGAKRWESLDALSSVHGTAGPGSGLDRNQRWRDWHQNRALRLPPVWEARREVPEGLAAVLDGMAEKTRESRFSLERVRELLGGGGSGVESSAGSIVEVLPVPSWKQIFNRVPAWAYATIGGAAVVAALIAVAIGNRGEERTRAKLREAIAHYVGTTGVVDESRARELFLQVADKGDPLARMWLARLVFMGRCGFQKDEEPSLSRAKEVLGEIRSLAAEGDSEAAFLVGSAFDLGLGVERDYLEAVKWWLRAAEKGDALAMDSLGNAYAHGHGVAKDSVEAVKWYRRAAEKGSAEAMFRLGLASANGDGVAKDSVEAVMWYRRAAEKGSANAMINLGIAYANGEGVAKNGVEGVKWIRRAAEKGDTRAIGNLGVAYRKGIGVAKDSVEAVKWYRRAVEKGSADAMYSLGLAYANGDGVEKDSVEAVMWYRRAAEKGSANAMYGLGWHYDSGIGVGKDLGQAINWWKKAARLGNTLAQKALKDLGETW